MRKLVLIAAMFLCIAVARISLILVLPLALFVSLVAARKNWL